MPAPMTRARRLRIERAVECTYCHVAEGKRCRDDMGRDRDPHLSRIALYEALRPVGGARAGSIAGQTVPVPLGADMPQYRALPDADKARVREAMALRGKAEIADIAHGRG